MNGDCDNEIDISCISFDESSESYFSKSSDSCSTAAEGDVAASEQLDGDEHSNEHSDDHSDEHSDDHSDDHSDEHSNEHGGKQPGMSADFLKQFMLPISLEVCWYFVF